MIRKNLVLACCATALFLFPGCSGGDSSATDGSGSGYQYSFLSATSGLTSKLQALHQKGGAGSAYVSDFILAGETAELYLDPTYATATFSYRAVAQPADATGWQTLLNTEGANGYAYKSSYMLGTGTGSFAHTVFVKDHSSSATFTYRVLPLAASLTETELNLQGGQGYRYWGTYMIGVTPHAIYGKKNGDPATFAYAFTDGLSTRDALLAEMNARGAMFYGFRGQMALGTAPNITIKSLYEKVSSTASAISYDTAPPSSSITNLVAKANEKGASGFWYLSDYAFSDGQVSIFVKGPMSIAPLYGTVLP